MLNYPDSTGVLSLLLDMHDNFAERKANRLRDYDYSLPGYYFLTICTKNRICYFGDVKNEKMYLNEIGQIIRNNWLKIDSHYKVAMLDDYTIMPNHLHGIIIISDFLEGNRYSAKLIASKKKNSRHALLSTIIRTFKTLTKKEICRTDSGSQFEWQRSFYDHIIRNEKSLMEIREYIRNNPLKWHLDKYYK